jgi:hypothetical protein
MGGDELVAVAVGEQVTLADVVQRLPGGQMLAAGVVDVPACPGESRSGTPGRGWQ